MPEHDYQAGSKPRCRKLDAADLRRRHDVSGDTNYKKIAETLVKNQLRRHSRVGAAQYDRERFLAVDHIITGKPDGQVASGRLVVNETRVSFAKASEGSRSTNHSSKVLALAINLPAAFFQCASGVDKA